MVTIPNFEEEDAKRPSRERETLVKERTRLINAMKSDLTRLGICNFNPKLRRAPEKLETLRTPEGPLIPPNTLAKLLRDMERLRLVMAQVKAVEAARLERLERSPADKPHAMVVLLARVVGIGIETADMRGTGGSLAPTARSARRGALCRSHGLTG